MIEFIRDPQTGDLYPAYVIRTTASGVRGVREAPLSMIDTSSFYGSEPVLRVPWKPEEYTLVLAAAYKGTSGFTVQFLVGGVSQLMQPIDLQGFPDRLHRPVQFCDPLAHLQQIIWRSRPAPAWGAIDLQVFGGNRELSIDIRVRDDVLSESRFELWLAYVQYESRPCG